MDSSIRCDIILKRILIKTTANNAKKNTKKTLDVASLRYATQTYCIREGKLPTSSSITCYSLKIFGINFFHYELLAAQTI